MSQERTMSDAEYLDAIWEHDVEWAQITLLETGSVRQMVIVHIAGSLIVVFSPGAQTRRDFLEFIRALCIAYEAFAVSVFSEAWMLRAAPGVDMTVDPSKSPNRIEVLAVHMSGRADPAGAIEHRASYRPIVRDGDGKLIGLSAAVKFPEGGEHAGAFTSLLPTRRPTYAERRRAKLTIARARGKEISIMQHVAPPVLH
jgi:hypothetical protein